MLRTVLFSCPEHGVKTAPIFRRTPGFNKVLASGDTTLKNSGKKG
nr:MAG TPA: hypothetical protein [Caudoviricetes sp.]